MIYQQIYSRIIYPFYHWAVRDGANRAIKELDYNESLSPDALQMVVEKKLRRLVEFASTNVPYYRNLFRHAGISNEDARIISNFKDIPFLTRAAINENLQSLTAEKMQKNGLDANSTGGSTGEVLRFYTDWNSGAYRKATVRRNKRWIGIHPGDREVRLWGAAIDLRRSQSVRGAIHSIITREKILSADTLDEHTLQSYLKCCKSIQPKLFVAYPSALAEFARFCRSNGESISSLRAIICSAESLFEHDRELIEKTFNVRVYNRYGCREVGDIAQEAPGVAGLLVNSDRVFVEILDENGRACGPGEQGEVVVTDLDNYGMPLIRYQIGDYARWAECEESKSSRFPFPMLASVDGRVLDIVRSPSGQRTGGTYWTLLLRSRPGFKKFQVVQTKPNGITILYTPESDRVPDFAYFESEIAKTCGEELRVEFTRTTRFEHAPGTKFRLVLNKIS